MAEEPVVTVEDAAGLEDTAIPLDIQVTFVDGTPATPAIPASPGDKVEIVISGVPAGAELSAGNDNGDGTWTLDPEDLEGLGVTPPPDSNDDFTMTVSVTVTDKESGDVKTDQAILNVDVTGVADAPTVTVTDVTGGEDAAIALGIGVALADTDGSESIISVVISGVPADAIFSAGADDGSGNWTVPVGDLAGLTVAPPADSDADFSLTVAAVSTEADGDTAETVATFNVDVTGVADAPTVTVTYVTGGEDAAIALGIGLALADTDGSESITSVVISGVPAGALLSAGSDDGNGNWTRPGRRPRRSHRHPVAGLRR